MVNIRTQEIIPNRDIVKIKCPKHDIIVESWDDIVDCCPTEGCSFITLVPKLANSPTPIYWHYCETCQQQYPTLDESICTICDDSMKSRFDELIGG